ncbi:hypothetical protein KML24001_01710 [Alistipes onderdonkii subsp. vulgaris]
MEIRIAHGYIPTARKVITQNNRLMAMQYEIPGYSEITSENDMCPLFHCNHTSIAHNAGTHKRY